MMAASEYHDANNVNKQWKCRIVKLSIFILATFCFLLVPACGDDGGGGDGGGMDPNEACLRMRAKAQECYSEVEKVAYNKYGSYVKFYIKTQEECVKSYKESGISADLVNQIENLTCENYAEFFADYVIDYIDIDYYEY